MASALFNIRDFGAIGDGQTKDTAAINAAIEACSAAGGGTVFVPAGRFPSGRITLKSNITLFLDSGATILGSTDQDDFPPVEGWWSNNIHAQNATNIAIIGTGTIDGCGQEWWRRVHARQAKVMRPNLIGFKDCTNVLIRDVMLVNSPMWTIRPIFCENVTIDRVSILNPADSPNTDGVNPDACRNVHISNCTIDVGDDCITIKSGKQDESGRRGRPCENVTVTNCTMVHGHGGVVIGSETTGGIKNVVISNCVFQDTDRGIRIKSIRGRGGVIEDIRVSNIVMENVLCPFVMNTFYACDPLSSNERSDAFIPQPVNEGTPLFRNVHFDNVTARNVRSAAAFIHGLPEMPISGVTFDNIIVSLSTDPDNKGGQAAMVRWLGDTISAGISLYNADDVRFHNVRIEHVKGPGLSVNHSSNVEMSNLKVVNQAGEAVAVELNAVSGAHISNCRHTPGRMWLAVSGPSEGIELLGNSFGKGDIKLAPDVDPEAVMGR